ncbi:cation-translocating P-type ATPase [Paraflavitalea sp. CAU 1676]|uniref:heavy metal translocating P-type ATPase n=1 Tax=Paraflavitalea sp. CAU 1676 TaxID=3032598 RepID=UPI0023D9FB74|nr:cation-translocating P-type ATPase [Paraflavitalea sp. CAU 1676]MDF2187385.1 cation-translocating P-type ATPase [Paraflavitalea sp. CAU 1676]
MKTVNWKVEGMTCSNCALTIHKYLEKEGMKDVKVSLASGDVSFELNGKQGSSQQIVKGIESLGYTVHDEEGTIAPARSKKFLSNHKQRFLFCLLFTAPLMLHMVDNWVHIHWLMNPWIQLTLCLPVYIVGMDFFGRSAIKSIRNGMPNMNVLVAIGSTAAFLYSLIGTLFNLGEGFLFYETAASVITLVFLGNFLEDASIQSTQRALNKLAKSQKVMANMIAYTDGEEHVFPVENTSLRAGDLILIKNGEQVPADCKILSGDATVNESILTGESMPLHKKSKDTLIGGSLIVDGTIRAQVTTEAKDSVLANIINLVKRAQGEKPPVQQMADKISAIFVPIVLGIAAVTFIVNFIILHNFTASLMRSIAVLVIACPCAMGLATPAAIAVGLGRAARNGILFRNSKSLELFRSIKQVVFDKTGTLTTGKFVVAGYKLIDEKLTVDEFKKITTSLEKYSNHPIAQSIATAWKHPENIRWQKIEEIKGQGMKGIAMNGDVYQAGSYQVAMAHTRDDSHNVYIMKNDELLGWIDVKDEIRPEAIQVVQYLRHKNIRTILLSGDRYNKCHQLANFLGIDEVIAEKSPEEKLTVVEDLTLQGPTAMVGDGINDAPALAKATIGISLSEASQIAVQTADVVLMNKGIKSLPLSLGLGRHTFLTIKQNLFWAFFYNIIAIPVAAFGLLTPTFGALVMGLSDVVLALNSVRLFVKKVT